MSGKQAREAVLDRLAVEGFLKAERARKGYRIRLRRLRRSVHRMYRHHKEGK